MEPLSVPVMGGNQCIKAGDGYSERVEFNGRGRFSPLLSWAGFKSHTYQEASEFSQWLQWSIVQ